MPEQMTGVELADRLRELRPRLKVVISSGYSTDATGRPLVWPDGITFLAKPDSPRDLSLTRRRSIESGVDERA